jgi:molybdopterin-binding protein
MLEPLDIFKIQNNGAYLWKGAAKNLEIAKFAGGTVGDEGAGSVSDIQPNHRKKNGPPTRCNLERGWILSLAGRILPVMTLSARNRLEGKVVEIQLGGVMAHVVISVGKNLIESVITKRSADEMKLKVGDTVSAVIKSTEVMLEKN